MKRYRIKSPTISVLRQEGKDFAVTIPAGAVLEVQARFSTDPMVEVRWDGRNYQMFVVDLLERSEELHSTRQPF